MAYDPIDQEVILFGGSNRSVTFNDTWAYAGGSWTQLHPSSAPPADALGTLTFDAADGYLVLFGGGSGTTLLPSTWTFSGGRWAQVLSTAPPQGRFQAGADYDPELGGIVLFGGNGDYGVYSDLWLFSRGGWSELAANTSIGYHDEAPICWDSVDRMVLLFGGLAGYVGGGATQVTWGYGIAPSATISAADPHSDTGIGILVSMNVTGGLGPFTYAWAFGDGTRNTTPTPSHEYRTPGGWIISLRLTDLVGETANASLRVVISEAPTVSIGVPLSSTDVGVVSTYSALLNNGTGPFTFNWSFGLEGSRTGESVSFAFQQPGNLTVGLNATDSAGARASATATVKVHNLPSVSIALLSNSPSAGTALALRALVTGGTPPYAASWGFGDGSVGIGLSANHTFQAAGTYTVAVSITDGAGQSQNATSTVAVASSTVEPLAVFVIIGLTAAAVAAAVGVVIWRRSRRDR
ncbi:MAG: PKD domain-containing protein [Thermoplasmata archaeon]|nr:PKD domain-containing protein [Thermoplasmata archaeon]